MRVAIVLFLFAIPALAEGSLAKKFPAGASAYLEVAGLGQKLDAVLETPFFTSLQANPRIQALLSAPQVVAARAKFDSVRKATGFDEIGLLKAVAGRRIAVAIYGSNARIVAMARMNGQQAERLMSGAEQILGIKRREVRAAEKDAPPVYAFGPALVFFDGECLVLTPNPLLANAIRNRVAKGLDTDARYLAARERVGRKALFAYADLTQYQEQVQKLQKPKQLGEAILLGAFAHYIKRAPWVAFGADLLIAEDDLRVIGEAVLPAPDGEGVVEAAYRGTLKPLPFTLPARTIGVIRMRRDLASIWSNREELIAKRGIPGLIQFETNFGNIAGGMSWVEEVLPNLGEDFIVVGTRPEYPEGQPAPAVRFPQGAMLIPLKNADELGPKLQVAFNNAIAIINITQGMKGYSFLTAARMYKQTRILEATYMSATKGEMAGKQALPMRFNFKPACAVVGDHFVVASHSRVLEQVIDTYGKPGPVARNVNAGIWLEPGEIRRLLAENREPLIAQSMIKESKSRAEAAGEIDLLLDLARHLRSFSLTSQDTRHTIGVRLEIGLGAPWESRKCTIR